MRIGSLLLLGLVLSVPAAAQISFTGEYYQDFEDLGTDAQAALPDGWRVSTHSTVEEPGAYADARSTTDLRGGSFFAFDSPAGIVNFGSGPEDTAFERALGVSLRGGEVESGIIYVHFRNDTGAAIQEDVGRAYARETYRGGGSGRVFADEFLSRDGLSWTPTGSGGASTVADTDGSAFPPIGGSGVGFSSLNVGAPILPGEEWYLAYRFYTFDPAAPAQALDRFAIASPRSAVGVVFLRRGVESNYGPVFLGDVAYGGRSFNVLPWSAPAGVGEITGPHASDFIVTEVESFGSSQSVSIEFRPTAEGWRDAEVRLFAADTVSRPVALRGYGVDPIETSSDDALASGTLTVDAWPNPSAGAVRLRVGMPAAGPARLSVHDALGREVAVVLDRVLAPGDHDATFDPQGLPPGVYFTRLTTSGETVTSSLTVSR